MRSARPSAWPQPRARAKVCPDGHREKRMKVPVGDGGGDARAREQRKLPETMQQVEHHLVQQKEHDDHAERFVHEEAEHAAWRASHAWRVR